MSERILFRLLCVVLAVGVVTIGVALWMLTHRPAEPATPAGVRTWRTSTAPNVVSTPFVPVTTLPPRPAVDLPSLVASTAVKAAPKVGRP